jgi:hypothetical protein
MSHHPWKRFKRAVNAFTVEALARGLVYYALAWLLTFLWREQRRRPLRPQE